MLLSVVSASISVRSVPQVYALDSVNDTLGDDVAELFEEVAKAEKAHCGHQFALSLKHLVALHNNLKCPPDIHKQVLLS